MALEIVTEEELENIRTQALKINELLQKLYLDANLVLVDFKIEFGLDDQGALVLGDELSPDNMRLIDDATGTSLDKDVFRRGEGDLRDGYEIVLHRLNETKGE